LGHRVHHRRTGVGWEPESSPHHPLVVGAVAEAAPLALGLVAALAVLVGGQLHRSGLLLEGPQALGSGGLEERLLGRGVHRRGISDGRRLGRGQLARADRPIELGEILQAPARPDGLVGFTQRCPGLGGQVVGGRAAPRPGPNAGIVDVGGEHRATGRTQLLGPGEALHQPRCFLRARSLTSEGRHGALQGSAGLLEKRRNLGHRASSAKVLPGRAFDAGPRS
jgi:hypothetical protein